MCDCQAVLFWRHSCHPVVCRYDEFQWYVGRVSQRPTPYTEAADHQGRYLLCVWHRFRSLVGGEESQRPTSYAEAADHQGWHLLCVWYQFRWWVSEQGMNGKIVWLAGECLEVGWESAKKIPNNSINNKSIYCVISILLWPLLPYQNILIQWCFLSSLLNWEFASSPAADTSTLAIV